MICTFASRRAALVSMSPDIGILTPSRTRGVRSRVAAALLAVAISSLAIGCQPTSASPQEPDAMATGETVPASCEAGTVRVGERCQAAEVAFVGENGTSYVVDNQHPSASDQNPGTATAPWRTISRAAAVLRPGDAVIIREGVYRESITPRTGGTGPRSRITYAAYPGETVVVTGADLADGWRRQSNGMWRRAWTGPSMETYSDDPVFRREILAVGGRMMRRVDADGPLSAGQYRVEGPSEAPIALVARFETDRLPTPTEVGHRTHLFWPEGPDPYADCGDPEMPGWFRIVGLTFQHAANRAQWGAVCVGSLGSLVEDVRVEWTVGQGIDVSGRNHVFRRTRADYNGQIGWGGSCTGCVIEDGSAVGNNWAGHDPFWEAGGIKLSHTTDTVVRRHYAAHNDGPGIWLDIDNARNTIEGCLVVGNEVAGIMLELNTTETLVQHNVVAATRWRSWSGAGVLTQAASRNAVLHNTLTANQGTGLWLRLDPSRRAPDGSNVVAHNLIAGNAASEEEAREISVEGTSPAHLRTTSFVSNRYGRLGADTYRSTFYAWPVDGEPAGFRGERLDIWERVVGEEDAQYLSHRSHAPVGSLPRVSVGAPGTSAMSFEAAGANRALVRAEGNWRGAPARERWP